MRVFEKSAAICAVSPSLRDVYFISIIYHDSALR
jgi:hypothetical protein